MIEDYVRNAKLVRVIDGDTFVLAIDCGFHLWIQQRVRLLGINCPEMKGPSKPKGEAAKKFVEAWFAEHPLLQVKTHLDKEDSFGRVLAEVHSGMESLGDRLLAAGQAVPYRQEA